MYKNEIARAAGVSRAVFRVWLKADKLALEAMGLTPKQQLLPPVAVRYLCEKYVIDVSYEWFAQISGGDLHPIDQYGIILNMNEHHEITSTVVSYDYRLKANGLTVTAQDISGRQSLTLEEVVLYLRVTNANGYEAFFMTPVTVMTATAIPTLTLVTTDANGHNVISWTNAESFQTIKVYKEGTSLNDFRLLGSVAASSGMSTQAQM